MKVLIFLCFILACFGASDSITPQIVLLSKDTVTNLASSQVSQAQQRINMIKNLLQSPLLVPGPNKERDDAINSIIVKLAQNTVYWITNSNLREAQIYINLIVDVNSMNVTTSDANIERNQAVESIISASSKRAAYWIQNSNLREAQLYIDKLTEVNKISIKVNATHSTRTEEVNALIAEASKRATYWIQNSNLREAQLYIDLLVQVNNIPTPANLTSSTRDDLINSIITEASKRATYWVQNSNLREAQLYINVLTQVNKIAPHTNLSNARVEAINTIIAEASKRATYWVQNSNLREAQLYIDLLVQVNNIPTHTKLTSSTRDDLINSIITEASKRATYWVQNSNLREAQIYINLIIQLNNIPAHTNLSNVRSEAITAIIAETSKRATYWVQNSNLREAQLYIDLLIQLNNIPTQGNLNRARDDLINSIITEASKRAAYWVQNSNLREAQIYIDLLAQVNKIAPQTNLSNARSEAVTAIIAEASKRAGYWVQNSNLREAQLYINVIVQVNNIPTHSNLSSSARDDLVNSIISEASKRATYWIQNGNLREAQLYIDVVLQVNKISVTSFNGKEARLAAVKPINDKLSELSLAYLRNNNLQMSQECNNIIAKLHREIA